MISALAAAASLAGSVPPRMPRYNEVYRIATHNSYWVKRDNAVEAFASGTQQRLLDQLLFHGVRGLEIDIHKDDRRAGRWTVYHTDKQSNSFCSPLAECLKQLRQFHHALPRHEVVTVVLELKEILGYNFDDRHTPRDLDRILEEQLGPHLYRPRDFLARCAPGATLRECAREAGWPTIDTLRGKFLFKVLGNWRWCTIGHGFSGWAEYASWGGGAAERSAFPMRSDWGDHGRERCGDEYIPAFKLKAAMEGSVFMQVENVHNETHMKTTVAEFLASGGVVRGADSFGLGAQAARVAAGFHLLQTDYPWVQINSRGITQPFRPVRESPGFDPAAFIEPGSRLELARTGAGTGSAFAYLASTAPVSIWETLPSTTRPSPKKEYPNASWTRAKACLTAASTGDPSLGDSLSVCRQTADGRWYRRKPLGEDAVVTVETSRGGATHVRRFVSGANKSRGIGDQLRLAVWSHPEGSCVAAFSASEIGPSGEPAWVMLGVECFRTRLSQQGLSARWGDVRFFGTRRTAVSASGDWRSGYVPASELVSPDFATGYMLTDLSTE